MAEKGIPFPWRWNGGTIFTYLDVIWGMSDKMSGFYRRSHNVDSGIERRYVDINSLV